MASGSVTLAATELAVVPGGTASTTATVYNGGNRVEEFVVAVIGPPAGWATVEPATVHIYPGDRAECTIRLTPPRHSSTRPGRADFTVTASSTLNTALSVGAPGVVDVGTFRSLEATLVPQRSTGRWRTVHRIDLSNTGNVVEAVRITATDAGGELRFVMPAAEIPVPPGDVAVGLSVYPPRRLFGRPLQYPFQVIVKVAPPTPPLRLDGLRQAVPRIAGWIPKLTAALAALAIAAAVIVVLTDRNTPRTPTPTPTVSPLTQTTAPASPTVANSPTGAQTVQIPDGVGQNLSDFEAQLDALGITYTATPQTDDVHDANSVLSVTTAGQPAAGMSVPPGTEVQIVYAVP